MKIEGEIGLYLQAQIITKDGEIKHDTGKVKAKCWTKNMPGMWATLFTDRLFYSYLTATTGFPTIVLAKTSWDSQATFISIKYTADVGIVVGRDDTLPEAWDNANLGDYIDDGASSGELTYGTMDYSDNPKVVSGGVEWTMFREFTNNSGAPITVKEIGIISQFTNLYDTLVARDILPSSQAVADTDVLRVSYTIRTGAGYTLQFLQLIADIWTFRSKATVIKQIDGDSVAIIGTASWDSYGYPISMYSGQQIFDTTISGILVGTGNAAESLTDYTLETPIASGEAAGELVHHKQSWLMDTEENWFKPLPDGTMAIVFSRLFENRTAASITIREVGVAVTYALASEGNAALILRKVLDTPIVVPAGGYTTVIVSFKFPQG